MAKKMTMTIKEFEDYRSKTNPIIIVSYSTIKGRERVIDREKIKEKGKQLIKKAIESKKWQRKCIIGGVVCKSYKQAAMADYAFLLAFPSGVCYVWHTRDFAFKTPWGDTCVSDYRIINKLFLGCGGNFAEQRTGKEKRPRSPFHAIRKTKRKIVDQIIGKKSQQKS